MTLRGAKKAARGAAGKDPSPSPSIPPIPQPTPAQTVLATPELLSLVLTWLRDRDLADCASVCKSWLTAATALLWREWTIEPDGRDEHDRPVFKRLDAYQNMPRDRQTLVRPTICSVDLTQSPTGPEERDLYPIIGKTVKRISPFVRHWHIRSSPEGLFAVIASVIHGDQLLSLEVGNLNEAIVPWVNDLLSECPRLRALLVTTSDGNNVRLPLDMPALTSLCIHCPSELQMVRVASYPRLTRICMARVLRASDLQALTALTQLKYLLLPRCTVRWGEGLEALIQAIGRQLIALDLSSDSDETVLTSAMVDSVARNCPNLEMLALDEYAGVSITTATRLWLLLPKLRTLSLMGEEWAVEADDGALLLDDVVRTRPGPNKVLFFFRSMLAEAVLCGCRPVVRGYPDWSITGDWELFLRTNDYSVE